MFFSRRIFLTFSLAMFFGVLSLGCAHKVKAPQRAVTLAVLDGTAAPDASETRRSVAGWWLGSRDRFDNGNAPTLVAEAVAEEFTEVPGVHVFSRIDLAAYMMQKERILMRRYGELTPQQRLDVLRAQSPIDYGRSLNVDYVMTNHVTRSRLVHNRTFHWWLSKVDFDLELWDVESGQRIWVWRGDDTDLFDSQLAVIEELAREAREEALEQDVFQLGL